MGSWPAPGISRVWDANCVVRARAGIISHSEAIKPTASDVFAPETTRREAVALRSSDGLKTRSGETNNSSGGRSSREPRSLEGVIQLGPQSTPVIALHQTAPEVPIRVGPEGVAGGARG